MLRTESGDGFEVLADDGGNVLTVKLSPSLAHAIGAVLWRALANEAVDDRRAVFAAALCNQSERLQAKFIGREPLCD